MKKVLTYSPDIIDTALKILNTLRIAEGLDNAENLLRIAQLLKNYQVKEIDDEQTNITQEINSN